MNNEIAIRKIMKHELPQLLELYKHLNKDDPELTLENVQTLWEEIYYNKRTHYIVADNDGQLVASCVLTIVPNLTRGARPYGLIENVVTHSDFRRRGLGTKILGAALRTAWEQNCYKVMLLTGSKKEETLSFYEKAGFKRDIKTGFIATPLN
ncbi:GNAT family N-acetyltransferase [Paenibacillus mesophilus]|uniref:GNAT family N-acetyltransferase n=1 Tax=Paenibacillus mesophilus TaxID=2582849 RepID=UPI00110F514C|nr:GNAT family N-acetyltransferase [Paenibacillus mesophilus]TMV43256.1 GNAT family N-acetyltransferase [Paenibacillus mesophilus]